MTSQRREDGRTEDIEALKHDRLRLLNVLTEQDISSGHDPFVDWTPIHEEYNTIVDKLDEQRRRSNRDPLKLLPHELSLSIFQEMDTDELLVLTMVSKHWRDAILSAPTLWTQIMLEQNFLHQDEQAKTVTQLFLSQDSLLTLHLPGGPALMFISAILMSIGFGQFIYNSPIYII